MDCGLTGFRVLRRVDAVTSRVGHMFAPKPDAGAAMRYRQLIIDGYLQPVIDGDNAEAVAVCERRLGLHSGLDADFDGDYFEQTVWREYVTREPEPKPAEAVS